MDIPRKYPLTIAMDRYGGAYSKGPWLAFRESPDEVPQDPWDGDPEAAAYWRGEGGVLADKSLYYEKGGRWHPDCVGRGETPEEAVADLVRREAK